MALCSDYERKHPQITREKSFKVGELIKQASWCTGIGSIGHWRTHDGHEVDFVVEHHDGMVTGFEVKAASRISQRDARGLRALRDALGSAFNSGIVLSTGELAYRLDDNIAVVPIERLWT